MEICQELCHLNKEEKVGLQLNDFSTSSDIDLSHYYTLRVDANETFKREDIKAFLDREQIPRYLMFFEIANKTKKEHYQGFIYLPDNSAPFLKIFRDRIRHFFKSYAAGSFSCAKINKANYLIYVTKDGDLVCKKDISNTDVDILQSQSYKKERKKTFQDEYMDYMNTEYKYYNFKNLFRDYTDILELKQKTSTSVEGMPEEERQEQFDYAWHSKNKILSNYNSFRKDVFKKTLKFFGKNVRLMDTTVIKKFVNMFINVHCHEFDEYLDMMHELTDFKYW